MGDFPESWGTPGPGDGVGGGWNCSWQVGPGLRSCFLGLTLAFVIMMMMGIHRRP